MHLADWRYMHEDVISITSHSQVCAHVPVSGLTAYGLLTIIISRTEATIPTHVFSLSETDIKDMHENQKEALLNHNKNFMMRVFPSAIRVTSSNMDPSLFWKQGAQMVALNWQNFDMGMMLNEAMFAGRHGWVLKPQRYRGMQVDSSAKDIDRGGTAVNISIAIFAGQGLALPLGDSSPKDFHPYVTCQLHLSQDEDIVPKNQKRGSEAKRYKLRTKASTGIDPDFGGEELTFPHTTAIIEELSFLRFVLPCPFTAVHDPICRYHWTF
jgi:Phosphatidylinositol-specific phospholipase C, Y domain